MNKEEFEVRGNGSISNNGVVVFWSQDGEEMVLVWSDAMENEQGQSHTVNYRWNQMKIKLVISGNHPPPSAHAGEDQSIQAA